MRIPTPASPDPSEDPLLVTSRLEIASLLRGMKEHKALISVRLDHGSHTMVTTLLDINAKRNSIIIDAARDARFNSRAAQADSIRFEAMLDKIQIKFSGTAAQLCHHEGHPALRLDFPESLYRIQRREFYRVATPASQPAQCTLTLSATRETPGRGESTAITLNLKDISLGGVSLIDNDKLLDVVRNTLYPGCSIALPEIGAIDTTLRIVQAFDETVPTDKAVRYIGCAFVGANNATLTTVQRYIGLLERKLGAKRFGVD